MDYPTLQQVPNLHLKQFSLRKTLVWCGVLHAGFVYIAESTNITILGRNFIPGVQLLGKVSAWSLISDMAKVGPGRSVE